MLTELYLRYLNVEHKWIDDTKTTVELMAKVIGLPNDLVIAYVHTTESIKECKEHEQDYIDSMLKTINENIKR